MALETLGQYARCGTFAPGSPIVIVEEARRLRLSTTPVREALAYLCGQGLIERAPAGGYLAPRLDVTLVRDRFAFRLHCLTFALDLAGAVRGLTGSEDRNPADVLGRMAHLVRIAGNSVLVEAFERVGGQLSVLLEPERRLFADVDTEATALSAALDQGDRDRIREGLQAYHQRRIEAAGALVLEIESGRIEPGSRPD